MSSAYEKLDPPVDTVGDGTEYAGYVQTGSSFGTTARYTQGGFASMAAAQAWAKAKKPPRGHSVIQTGAYRVLRKEHR